MVVIDNVTDVILKVLRDCPSLNVQAMDSDNLHDLVGQLNDRVLLELEKQNASLFPIFGNDMSVAFHNLRSTIRRLGTSAKFSLTNEGDRFTATIEGNGSNFHGEVLYRGVGKSNDAALAIDFACREVLAEMAKATK